MNARAIGAHADPTRAAHLAPAHMAQLPGADCDIYFDRSGSHFTGEMRRGACAFDLPANADQPPQRVYSWTRAEFDQDRYWYKDGWYLPETDAPFQLFHFDRFVELEKVD